MRGLSFYCLIAIPVVLAFGWASSSALAADSPVKPNFAKEVQPFLQQYCLRCHGSETQGGDFRIDTLSRDFINGPDAELWVEVMTRLNAGEMPPVDEPQPKADEISQVVNWLSNRIKEGEAARLAKRQQVTHYRLSREEYAHTIYDLLGVHYDAADPGNLSEDPEWHGFQRLGSKLSLAPSHVEKYFEAAQTILEEAYPEKEPETIHIRKGPFDLEGGVNKAELEAAGLADKMRILLWPDHGFKFGRPGPGRLQSPGVYKVRVTLSGVKPPNGRLPHLSFYDKTHDRMLFEQDILTPEDEPTTVEFQTHLPAGSHYYIVNNNVPGPSNLPRSGRSSRVPFFSLKDQRSRAPWQRKVTDDQGRPLYPLLIVDSIEWEGPIRTEAEQQRRAAFWPKQEGDLEEARVCLTRFASTAWRRPAEKAEIDRYMKVVRSEIEAGESFSSAVKAGMLGVLSSQNFYYLSEGSPQQPAPRVNDWELASRLSYFLWSSMPDEELFRLAEQGILHKPEVLRSQVRRMMDDPKIERFTASFPRQWLQLAKVGMFPPDKNLYPEYDPWLEESMILESTEFFAQVFTENLSLRDFLHSDWTMLNPRLAMHYQLPELTTPGFQKVALQPQDHRGGILTQASVLSLTSDGTRHRPVHRGVWVSEAIFGKTPPPPPPNVEPIEPNPVDAPKATIRMKLEAHATHASCNACHRNIDPLGFAFDNYDAIGRWRTEEVVSQGKGANPKVDASGVLPDGRSFSGPEQFQELLVDDLDRFGKAFVEKLAIYALRRAMTVDDHDDIAAIADDCKQHDYRLRDVIETLVLSDFFQQR